MAPSPDQLLTSLLKDVSRSFYRTLRVLPAKIRTQISLAYLLARLTDTVADTGLMPLERRLEALQHLRERILGTRDAPVELGEFARQQALPAEGVLLDNCERALALLGTLSAADLALVRRVLDTITSGQELDLRRFANATPEHVVPLRSDAELEDYTYRVAGCVGEFWTKMCRAHLFPRARLNDSSLLADSVRFGRGLQLVNILRDLPKDLRQGRCYLPEERLAACGLKPEELLVSANEVRLRPLYSTYLRQAEAHLQAGWAYTNALPWWSVRVRLACAWPILIGLETLKLLWEGDVLNAERRIKVSRRKVGQLIRRSLWCYPLPAAWRSLGAPVLPGSKE